MYRSRRVRATVVLSLAVTLLLLAMSAAAAPPPAAAQGPQLPPITLKSRTIKPTYGVDAATSAQLDSKSSDAKAKASSYHALVQLDHIPNPPEKAALAARGIHLQNYLPQQAWVARIDAAAGKASALVGKDAVAWVGALLPADKVAPTLASDVQKPSSDKDTSIIPVIVQFHDDVSLDTGRAVLAKFGARITNESSAINAVTAQMKPSDVTALSQQEEVLWLESPLPPLTATNSNTRARTNVDQVQNVAPYNLNGAGVNVLVYDVGRASHEDYNGRIIDQDGTSVADHSSHVAGTVLGNGSGAGTSVLNNRGMAPSAGLITYGYEDDGSNLFFYDNLGDIQADMQNGLNHNANIATASLGTNLAPNGTANINAGQPVGVFNCNREGDYAAGPQLLDQIVRGSLGRPLIMTWANGNERGDGRCGTQFNTTAPPATAKNPIQVGATQQNNDGSAGFSGWGPTDDGRLKPIVSAPGVSVLSTIPNLTIDNTGRNCNGTGDDFCWPYDTMSGTSMATPAVAGIAALMVQQFHNSYSTTTDPLPATVKAILMNSAASPSGGNGPDFQTGYGRVDARAAVDTIRQNRFVEGKVTSNGEVQRYHVQVQPGDSTLQVSLAWDDAAGTLLAATELVNDLDLRLIAPDGVTTWQPWVLNPAVPANAATRGNDTLNNQEMVTVPNPTVGWWTVEVRSTSLPQGPQTYGLAATHNPWSFNIVYPLTSAVADAGWFNGPGTFQIHLDVSDGFKPSTNLVTNLADPNALKLYVGPKQIDTGAGGEGGVIQRGPVGNQYWLVVRAPGQAAANLYDFRVDFLGALTKTETNAVRYNNTPTPPRALSLVVDTSGSMASYAQMPAAKDAARSIIMGTELGEGVAETQFNTNASLVQALLNVSAPGDRNAMAGNIAGLSPNGTTALGQGLTTGYSQISGDSRTQAMVLLSDGMENTPPMYDDMKSSIPTGVRLDTIALGPLADQALMARIANDHPGSTPWYVPTGPGSAKSSGEDAGKIDSVAADVSVASRIENRLTDVYHFIDNYQRQNQRLFESAGNLNSGGSTTLSVNLNESARFLYFTVNWADPTANINFVLHRPGGAVIPTSNPDVYRVDTAGGGVSKRYRIAAPAAGSWQMDLSNPSAFGTEFLVTVEGQVDTDLTLFTPSLGECRPTTPNKVCISFNDAKGNITGGRFEYLRARLSNGQQVQLVDRDGSGLYCSEDIRFEQPGMQSFKVNAMMQDRNGRWVQRVQRADFYCGPLDLPPVLLVNDAPSLERGGHYYPVRDMYVAALNAIGAQYNVWNTDDDGLPSGAALSQYQKVIWITGVRQINPNHRPLPDEAEKAVRQFLEARKGNTFALSSQDYLSVNGVTEFGKDVLGVEAFDDNTRGTTMRGLRASPLGHNFGAFPYGPPYTNMADVMHPIPDAAANLVDETGRVTGITHGYGQGCSAFFSFGLEGLPPGAFQDMLKRFLVWDCAPVALNTTATPQDVNLHYGDVYSTTFQIQNPLVGGLHVELNNGPTHLWLLTDSAGGVPSLLAPFNVGDLPSPQASAKLAPAAKTASTAAPLDPNRVVSRLCQVSAAGLADCFAGGVVSLDNLLDNDVAVVWNDVPLGDPDRVGDMLADFVDRGGTVLLGGRAIQDGPAGLGGRWAAEKYSPLGSTGAPKGPASLASIADPTDPLFAGVAALSTTNHLDAALQGDGELRATWSDGEALLATRSFQPGVGPQVIAINASFENGQWGGSLPVLIKNALGALDMTWRRPGWFRSICSIASPPIDSHAGAIPPIVFDGSASCPDVQGGVNWTVALQLDSRFAPASAFGGANPPHYAGKLTIDTNAMGKPRLAFPLSMTVLPADVTPTPTDTPSAPDTPTATPTPTETPAPTDTPTPTMTEMPADTATPAATPTQTPTPTITPTPYPGGPYKVYLPHVMRAP